LTLGGFLTSTPSLGDEFLNPLFKRFKSSLFFKNTTNPSVKATLELLEKIYKTSFIYK